MPSPNSYALIKIKHTEPAGMSRLGQDCLAAGNSLTRPCQGSPIPTRGINQPAFISCVCEGADQSVAFQSNFKGFRLNPRICPRRAGIHPGRNPEIINRHGMGMLKVAVSVVALFPG